MIEDTKLVQTEISTTKNLDELLLVWRFDLNFITHFFHRGHGHVVAMRKSTSIRPK